MYAMNQGMNALHLDLAASAAVTDLVSTREFMATAAREGLSGVEAMRANRALRSVLEALAAHCLELNDIDSGAAAAREIAENEARIAHADAIRARRAAALTAPALLILSTPIAVSVGPVGDPLHAAHERHSLGEPQRRFIRTADGRVRCAFSTLFA